jgi:hypothetical protein
MPVIVNEFETVAAPAAAPTSPTPSASGGSDGPNLALEIERTLRTRRERAARLEAV